MLKLRQIFILALVAFLVSCSQVRHAAQQSYLSNGELKCNGILEQRAYTCSVEGPSSRKMNVYLPAEYYQTSEHYPVLYLLHGARGNEQSWIVKGDLLRIVDSLTERGLMRKCIVVLPNTNQYKDDKDFGNSRTKGALESFFENNGAVEHSFVADVVAEVESRYRTIPKKSGRAIAGLSIGALQAIHISASHPDMFDYIGLFSPMVHPFAQHSHYSSIYRGLKKRQQIQFATPPKLYWVMIGKRDFFYPRMNCYCGYLDRQGYRHDYYISPGGHQWSNWKLYCNIFMQRLF